MKKKLIILISCLFLISPAWAINFVAQNIQFVGLQRISQDTAMSYLPVKPGSQITDARSDAIIRDLYHTGFFSNVQLSRQGNTLVIQVSERPVISKIILSGNKVIPSKELLKGLKQMKIAEGYEYNRSDVNLIKTALIGQYYAHGKYNAKINTYVTPQKNNSVALTIAVSEGVTATIKQINIVGNHVFSRKKLAHQFKSSTSNLLSFVTHNNQYASEKLAADLEKLRSHYLNHGYLKFKINSTQVSMTPDRKHVYITVKITEGPQYKFSGYRLEGNLVLPREKLNALVTVKAGEIFSRQIVINSEKAIGDALGEEGYFHVKVKTSTDVDDKDKTVFIMFNVMPGPRIYVRHIYFTGATNTNDFAFRRALLQVEGSLISTKQIEQSKRQLLQLPFVGNVDVTTQPVQNSKNQVDVNYKVATMPAGEVKAGVGYSDIDGLLINAGLTQQNVFGTGNQFGLNISYSAALMSANVNYYNPYYTTSGVGRGFNVYASRYDADEVNITDYATNNYGGAVNYNVPLSQHDSLQFGLGGDYLVLQANSNTTALVENFVRDHGDDFWQLPLNVGWTHSTLDRILFPKRGMYQTVNFNFIAPITSHSLEYYKATYDITYYQPIYADFIMKVKGQLGYGAGYGDYDQLPFFKNFYVGGMGTIRGYTPNTIGPQDSRGNAVGGNAMAVASASLIFPNPFSSSLRTAVFVDAGNVYNTDGHLAGTSNPNGGRIRVSTGVEFDWLSPLGMLNFSLAKAVNPTKQDDTSPFQFNIGTSF